MPGENLGTTHVRAPAHRAHACRHLPHSTRDIARRSHVCAINSCVAELRQHGAEIHCERLRVRDEWRFFYTMTRGPQDA
ncbi:hypothetical protein [Profundibacterium mesophilum]|uniref:Uncharacterized protein n=1 Tax=Profundibacterium mesophilum KAUST100406-0324 TaxID=1037889 RepID=A0A921NS94_9RHOB|nr:hypothetical protein [Profundibacterium mesophilum]KAF0674410.1 hypothetical protein PMES_03287 [Profundibacterium mesophilum KAUST100406-0324]